MLSSRHLRFSSRGWSFLLLLLGRSCGLAFGWLVILWFGRLRFTTIGRGPKGEVVTQQLHDEGAVAVRLLRERVEFGDSVIKRLLGQVAGTVRGVQDLVVEHREVQGKTETDGVSGSELSLSNIGSIL